MYLAAHESKTSEEQIFFPAILRKATTMCTLVRHILVHVHVSVKFTCGLSLVLGVILPYSVH